ncbi:pre-mRNA-splicing factor rse1 [Tulasnella sp. 419]|nr:pre-mRNA-splicing factor rse1 [Tulasnella sp. 419]
MCSIPTLHKFLQPVVEALELTEADPYDSYIILSFVNGTLVLSIGETIEEVSDTSFLSSAPTRPSLFSKLELMHCYKCIHMEYVTFYPTSALMKVPAGKTIVAATTNKRQVAIALSSAELVYFELDLEGQLNEYQDRKAMGSMVLTMSVGDVPVGRQRTPYLAVGCEDQTIRIISLDPDSTLETIRLQALTTPPSAICIADMLDASFDKHNPTMFVNIGLTNGVLLRTVLDPVNGQLTDTRTR